MCDNILKKLKESADRCAFFREKMLGKTFLVTGKRYDVLEHDIHYHRDKMFYQCEIPAKHNITQNPDKKEAIIHYTTNLEKKLIIYMVKPFMPHSVYVDIFSTCLHADTFLWRNDTFNMNDNRMKHYLKSLVRLYSMGNEKTTHRSAFKHDNVVYLESMIRM